MKIIMLDYFCCKLVLIRMLYFDVWKLKLIADLLSYYQRDSEKI